MRPLLPVMRLESSPGMLPSPGRADWALAALVATLSVAEVVLRDDIRWWPLALGVGLLLSSTMLWRRAHPLRMLVFAVGALVLVDVVSMLVSSEPFSLYAGSFVLVLVFSLLRWASTRHSTIGMGLVLLVWAVSTVTEPTGVEDAVGGMLVLLLTAALGLIVRYRAIVVAQHLDNVRATERESLARELHDTVAHRVSAITIQAQAGRWLASSRDIDGAAEALRTIEGEASLALAEMRSMVGALRRGGSTPALLIPQGRLASMPWPAAVSPRPARPSRWNDGEACTTWLHRWRRPCTGWPRNPPPTPGTTPAVQPLSRSFWKDAGMMCS